MNDQVTITIQLPGSMALPLLQGNSGTRIAQDKGKPKPRPKPGGCAEKRDADFLDHMAWVRSHRRAKGTAEKRSYSGKGEWIPAYTTKGGVHRRGHHRKPKGSSK